MRRYRHISRQGRLAAAVAGIGTPSLERPWGNVQVGDTVTTFGRHGSGQPAIDGTLVRVERGTAYIETREGVRQRSINNVRKAGQL